jgi:ankyrin repeat protein
MRKPIHYAAACENSDNLLTLIDMQANLSDIDMKKVSCLHIAAQAGRAENMKFILVRRPQLLKLKDRQGLDAMAYSCENQNQACIDVLL